MELGDKKVLVTGADGFVGSHLVEALVGRAGSLRVLAQYNSFNNWGWLETLDCVDELEVVTGDVRDPHFCRTITRGVQVIFHLAALIAIPYSYVAPDSYVDTNIKGTLNLCQAALDNGCERFVHTSTSEVYGTARYVPIDEAHPLQPQSPYSASKIGADSMALSFHHSFELPVVVARPFNTYGPRQSARAVIPTIITQLADAAPRVQLGDLTPTRDFSYVRDTCRAFILLAEADPAIGRVVNIGTNEEHSVAEVYQLICDLMNLSAPVETARERIRPGGSEVQRLLADNRLLKELTGYVPEHDLRTGLIETIGWFTQHDNLRKYKPLLYNV
ncbi:MAG: GDP-mannose 4,6-dehydratase [Armatimonadetes bacterium]|nr:GDP-mannose 4,6-dehydratase [Armatimonadota bacterium]